VVTTFIQTLVLTIPECLIIFHVVISITGSILDTGCLFTIEETMCVSSWLLRGVVGWVDVDGRRRRELGGGRGGVIVVGAN
jgi:hypothetical protein